MLERIGYVLMAFSQPALHERHLVTLRHVDPLGEDLHVRACTMTLRPAGHDDCLRVMMNHPLHELYVGSGKRHAPAVGPRLFGGGHGPRWGAALRAGVRRLNRIAAPNSGSG